MSEDSLTQIRRKALKKAANTPGSHKSNGACEKTTTQVHGQGDLGYKDAAQRFASKAHGFGGSKRQSGTNNEKHNSAVKKFGRRQNTAFKHQTCDQGSERQTDIGPCRRQSRAEPGILERGRVNHPGHRGTGRKAAGKTLQKTTDVDFRGLKCIGVHEACRHAEQKCCENHRLAAEEVRKARKEKQREHATGEIAHHRHGYFGFAQAQPASPLGHHRNGDGRSNKGADKTGCRGHKCDAATRKIVVGLGK